MRKIKMYAGSIRKKDLENPSAKGVFNYDKR